MAFRGLRLPRLGAMRGGGGADPFSPASLFADGEGGAWFDPSDISTLFQNAAGTTPVTAAGQSVGKILDKSGRGNHATQSTASRLPTYQTGAGLHWLEFDGVDDELVTGTLSLSGADPSQVMVAAQTSGTVDSNSGVFTYGFGTSNRLRTLSFNDNTTFKVDCYGNSAPFITIVSNSFNVFEGRFGSNVGAAINGGTIGANSTPVATVAGVMTLGRGVISRCAHKNYGTIVLHRHFTSDERADAVSFLNAKAGL
jgi:hypothetical protein